MPNISGRNLDDEFTDGEEIIVRDPAAAVAQREHRVLSVVGLTHLTETANSFSEGDAIGRSGGAWVLADANNAIPCLFVVWSLIDADDFLAIRNGKLTLPSHGMTPLDAQYYLSTTAGAHTDTKPGAGDIVQRTIYVLDANTVLANVGDPEE